MQHLTGAAFEGSAHLYHLAASIDSDGSGYLVAGGSV
jgi:hypothetical protein